MAEEKSTFFNDVAWLVRETLTSKRAVSALTAGITTILLKVAAKQSWLNIDQAMADDIAKYIVGLTCAYVLGQSLNHVGAQAEYIRQQAAIPEEKPAEKVVDKPIQA